MVSHRFRLSDSTVCLYGLEVMVGPMRLYVEQEHLEKAQHYVAVLFSRGVEVSIEVAEKLNARFFRFILNWVCVPMPMGFGFVPMA